MNATILNQKLEHESKKYFKACDQIKLLKQRISELYASFSHFDQCSMANSFNNNTNDQLRTDSTNDQLTIDENVNCAMNVNLFKETVRKQIENLQSIKAVYFIYAQRKADEITKLQCDLYGEEAVREAYENAPPSVLIPASNSSTENSDSQVAVDNVGLNEPEEENRNYFSDNVEISANENSENMNEDNVNNNSNSISDYWTPWNFNNTNFLTTTNQLQLIEYEF